MHEPQHLVNKYNCFIDYNAENSIERNKLANTIQYFN